MIKVIQHHVKYKEIHGVDEIVLMTKSDHTRLHRRLRQEGKCNISPKELHKLSGIAKNRTPTGKARTRRYTFNRIQFKESIGKTVRIIEDIKYNPKTGAVKTGCYFQATNYKHLYYIDI